MDAVAAELRSFYSDTLTLWYLVSHFKIQFNVSLLIPEHRRPSEACYRFDSVLYSYK